MRRKLRVCGSCNKLCQHEQLSEKDALLLAEAAKLGENLNPDWCFEAWWCSACQSPWFAVWPELVPSDVEALYGHYRPKGGGK